MVLKSAVPICPVSVLAFIPGVCVTCFYRKKETGKQIYIHMYISVFFCPVLYFPMSMG